MLPLMVGISLFGWKGCYTLSLRGEEPGKPRALKGFEFDYDYEEIEAPTGFPPIKFLKKEPDPISDDYSLHIRGGYERLGLWLETELKQKFNLNGPPAPGYGQEILDILFRRSLNPSTIERFKDLDFSHVNIYPEICSFKDRPSHGFTIEGLAKITFKSPDRPDVTEHLDMYFSYIVDKDIFSLTGRRNGDLDPGARITPSSGSRKSKYRHNVSHSILSYCR